jgi:hypothetical protein
MTKHKLICTLLLTVSICACTAEQSYKKTIGLRAVQAAFLVKFLDAKGMIWKKEIDHEFECEFKANGKKTWANFDLLGKWPETETLIEQPELFAMVLTLLSTNCKDDKNVDVYLVETANGSSSYEKVLEKSNAPVALHFEGNGKAFNKKGTVDKENDNY